MKQVASRTFRRQSKWLSAVAIASVAIIAAENSLGQSRPDAGASTAIDHGNQSLRIGAFAAAADQFRQAAAEYEKTGSPARQIEAISAEATALCNLGKYPDAIAVLRSAVRAAHASKDQRLEQLSTIQLAEALILSRNDEMGNSRLPTAQALLTSASDATHSDSVTPIALSSAFGDLYLAENKPDLAADSYSQSFTAAQAAGDDAAAAHAAANAALASLTQFKALTDPDRIVVSAAQRRQDAAQAIARAAAVRTMDNQAMAAAGKLSDSHDTAYVWLTVGQTEEGLAAAITSAGPGITAMPQPDPNLVAYSAYQSGLAAADAIGDATARAYALGYTGHLYELQKRIPDAMTLTRQAVFLAQQTQNFDCLYRWQWQTGRLLHASADQMRSSGDLAGARQADAEALESYRRAAMTLQSIRTDIGAGGGNQPANGSFHGVAEGVFYELADLLLRQADSDPTVSGEVLAQHDLLEARDTVEQLKTAQVQNYFHERCDALIQSKGVDVATINAKTAVIYMIPLRDRTELLVAEPAPRSPAAPDGYIVRRFRAEVSENQLTSTVRRFRLQLMDVTSNDYVPTAVQLYQWLMAPMEQYLHDRGVDTLVFIPDGALRTIPMSALYDGKQFLIEKYAVAISPGLKLTEPQSVNESQFRLFASGLSTGGQSSAPLPNVRIELNNLHSLYGGDSLLDSAFKVQAFDNEMSHNDFSVVHIASHGQFGDDPSQTFVQAYDGPMDLNHLEQVIEPSKYKGNALELLSLSACETAAGSDRAALGLAGVALKAGARSALATLWSVNDDASGELVAAFYRGLKDPAHLTKAQALRQAQLRLIQNNVDVRFEHPYYWSPFLIIGNWL